MLQITDTHGTYTLSELPTAEEVLALASQILAGRVQHGALLSDPHLAGQFLQLQLAHETREVFMVAHLDTRHRVIACEALFYGTIDGAEVHPREVVKKALEHNSAAVVLAHNHPSGCLEPSGADRAVTQRLKEALKLVDIRLLDHFVVGLSGYTSMAKLGAL
ncbi:MAG: hypothetical protein A2X76_01520 [Lysobacterales bacterium GWF1_69_6]|nr:MAG: hypothetical protein A2X76_01520 [Xanthomonadales bacterium GWF1_69_6]